MSSRGDFHLSRQERRQQERDAIRAQGGRTTTAQEQQNQRGRPQPTRGGRGSRSSAPATSSSSRGASSSSATQGESSGSRQRPATTPDPSGTGLYEDLCEMLQQSHIELNDRNDDFSSVNAESRHACANTQKERMRLSLGPIIKVSHRILKDSKEIAGKFRGFIEYALNERCVNATEYATSLAAAHAALVAEPEFGSASGSAAAFSIPAPQPTITLKTKDVSLLADLLNHEAVSKRLVNSWRQTLSNFDESLIHIDCIRRREGKLTADPTAARLALSWEGLRKGVVAAIGDMARINNEVREFIKALRKGIAENNSAAGGRRILKAVRPSATAAATAAAAAVESASSGASSGGSQIERPRGERAPEPET